MNQDLSRSQYLKRLVEQLTTSGKPALDEEKFKLVKKICKSSDLFVVELFAVVMKCMEKNHAEIRLSALQICHEIFLRSHCFRELMLQNFKRIVELLIFHHPKRPPLKPLNVAEKLKTLAIKSIHEWHEKFEGGYKLLKLGYKYLKECKNVDFEGSAVITEQDRIRREEERRKEEEIRERKIKKVEDEMSEEIVDIKNIILEFNNTFKLLIPDLDNFFIPLENDIFDTGNPVSEEIDDLEHSFEYGSSTMQEHGLTKETNVQINLSNIHNIQETPDNEVIICTLKEQILNVEKTLLPKVKEWEQYIIHYSSSCPELIRRIIEFKRQLERIRKQYSSITIIPQAKKQDTTTVKKVLSQPCSSDDDDDDFIDVPFDDPRVISATASEMKLMDDESGLFKEEGFKTSIPPSDLEAAGSSGTQRTTKEPKVKSPKKKITDFSVDSFLDEEWEKPPMFQSALTGLTNIWSANEVLHDHESDVVKPTEILGIATRIVDFEREFEPVRWECRAPLPTGRLCPRKDRERCPLHGPIVPRDSVGVPVRPEDKKQDQKRQDDYERAHPAWQDPVLLAEIRASTGVELSMKKMKKRKKKYSNLTDIRALENTPRNRLKKKVLGKKSLRRLNNALSKLPQ